MIAPRHSSDAVSAGTEIPPPLVDSPKCPGCSLVGICLPDEVVFLKGGGFPDSGFGVQEGIDTEAGEIVESGHAVDDLGVEDSATSNQLTPPSPARASRRMMGYCMAR